MIKARLVFICNEIQKGIDIGKVIKSRLVILMINKVEDEFPLYRAIMIDRKDGLGE